MSKYILKYFLHLKNIAYCIGLQCSEQIVIPSVRIWQNLTLALFLFQFSVRDIPAAAAVDNG